MRKADWLEYVCW